MLTVLAIEEVVLHILADTYSSKIIPYLCAIFFWLVSFTIRFTD